MGTNILCLSSLESFVEKDLIVNTFIDKQRGRNEEKLAHSIK